MKYVLLVIFFTFYFNIIFSQYENHFSNSKILHSISNNVGTIFQIDRGIINEVKSNSIVTMDVEIKQEKSFINFAIKFLRTQIKCNSNNNENLFDSDKKIDMLNGHIGKNISPLIGKTFVFSITNKSNLFNTINTKDNRLDSTKSIFSNIDESIAELYFFLPNSFKVGVIWSENDSSNPDKTKFCDYKVVSFNDREVMVSFDGHTQSNITKHVLGNKTITRGKSNYKGILTVDVKTGFVKSKKTCIDSNGTTEINGQIVPFTSKQTMTTINNL